LPGRPDEASHPAPRPDPLVDEPDDRALLAAHVAGDPDAFGVLFRRHRDRLWAVALGTTGDAEEAADALQDALVSAFRRAGSYRGDAAVTTWLHRVVVNACLDRLRRRKVRAADPLPDDLEEYAARGTLSTGTSADPVVRDAADPLHVVLDEEQRAVVLRALDTLPPDQRAALVLVDMQGYSVDDAAAVLGCPAGTVKSRCSRGRARLVPLLSDLRQADRGRTTPAGVADPRERPDPSRPVVRVDPADPDGNPGSSGGVQAQERGREVSEGEPTG
jgi:RNA polymerase sigma-70 factor (ECF subfamily)